MLFRLIYLERPSRTPASFELCSSASDAFVVGLAALFLDVATSTSFINFGAFSAFTLVNLSVIAHFLRNRPQRGASALLVWLALPLAGAAVDLYLLTQLDIHAVVFGVVWMVIGVLLLTYLTRGFRQAPPQLSIDEGSEAAP